MPLNKNQKKRPKTVGRPKGRPSNPGHSIDQLPKEQQRTINTARHLATLNRLKKELDRCYSIGPHGEKILWKRTDAIAIRRQMEVIRQMLEESQ